MSKKIPKKILKEGLFTSIKLETISHLMNGISDQNVVIPIPDHDDIPVATLIKEVEKETEIGIRYMGQYIENLSTIARLKRGK